MMGQTENVMSGAAAPQVQAAAAAVGRPAESAAVLEVQAQHPARRPPSPSLRQSPPQAKRSKPSVDVPVGVPVVQVLGDAPECVPCGGDEAEEAEQGVAPAVAYVVGLPQMTRERQGAARASLSAFTEAVMVLELLHARFGGSSGEQAETTHARLGPLVAPLRSAARALNLSMQAGGTS